MKYFREPLTLLMPMCTTSPLLCPYVLPPPPYPHLHVPRILFERFITRTLSLCSPGQMSTAWQTDSRISRVSQSTFDCLLSRPDFLSSGTRALSLYRYWFISQLRFHCCVGFLGGYFFSIINMFCFYFEIWFGSQGKRVSVSGDVLMNMETIWVKALSNLKRAPQTLIIAAQCVYWKSIFIPWQNPKIWDADGFDRRSWALID